MVFFSVRQVLMQAPSGSDGWDASHILKVQVCCLPAGGSTSFRCGCLVAHCTHKRGST